MMSPSQPLSARMRGLLFNFVLPMLLLACGAGVIFALGTVAPAKRPMADSSREGRLRALPPVRVTSLRSLQETGERLRIKADGVVVPFRETDVAAEVAGRIVFKSDACEAGSFVRAGDVLMRIDATDYELQVEQLTRSKEQAYQQIRELDQEASNTQRLITVAEDDVALQQKEVDRQLSMPKGFSSQGEIDQAKRALLAARQALVTQQNQLDLIKSRRSRLEASEQLAAAQLRAAEIDLARTEIKAPIDGVIVSEAVDLNDFVQRGTTLMVIEDTSSVDVAVNLRADQLFWILDQDGASDDADSRGYRLPRTPAIVDYQISGLENKTYRYRGELLSYDGIGLDAATRTVPVRVVVEDPKRLVDRNGHPLPSQPANSPALVRGMYVEVSFLVTPSRPLVVVPAEALQPGNRVFQFVADESVLERTVTPTDLPEDPQTLVSEQADALESPLEASKKGSETEDDFRANFGDPATGGSADAAEVTPFDPKRWTPGYVRIVRQVVPVDALSVAKPSADASDTEMDAALRRFWVCQVDGDQLVGGSEVVVSPLGNVKSKKLPVRAQRPVADQSLTANK